MARKVRNHPVPRDKMSENKLSEQTPKVKTHDFPLHFTFGCLKKIAEKIIKIQWKIKRRFWKIL